MISLVKNVKCISRLSIHYFDFCWLDIDRILHFVFHDKILQIYRHHWVRKFYQHILSQYRQISKKWGVGVGVGVLHTLHPPVDTPLGREELKRLVFFHRILCWNILAYTARKKYVSVYKMIPKMNTSSLLKGVFERITIFEKVHIAI